MLDDFIDLYRDDKKKEDYLIWYGQWNGNQNVSL